MTEERLIKILSELREIGPDKDYARKSRVLILSPAKVASGARFVTVKSAFEFLRLAAVTAFGIVLLLTIFGGVSYINKNFSPVMLSGLDQKSLMTEADEINNSIDVTLKEIKYLDNSNAATNKQIEQIADNKIFSTSITIPTSTDSRFDQKINDLLEKASQ